MRVSVIGAGAIGGLVAGRLSGDPGLSVDLCSRGPIDGLRIVADEKATVVPVNVLTAPAQAQVSDWVLVATKAHQTADAADWFGATSDTRTRVAVLQNGVEQVQRLAPFFAVSAIMPVIVTYSAEVTSPGTVVETSGGSLEVPANALGVAFRALTSNSGLEVRVSEHFDVSLWTKLARNVAANPLTAIADVPVQSIPRKAELAAMVRHLVAECVTVAAAEGIRLPSGLAERLLDDFETYPVETLSSMSQDRRRGRRLEFDAITGAVVRAAGRHAIPVPYCAVVNELLAAIST